VLGGKYALCCSGYFFCLAFECTARAPWPVVSGADGNALNFVVVSAVQAESFMHVVWVHACVFGFELLATHRGTMVHGTQRDAFDVSSIFKVCTISTTFYLHSLLILTNSTRPRSLFIFTLFTQYFIYRCLIFRRNYSYKSIPAKKIDTCSKYLILGHRKEIHHVLANRDPLKPQSAVFQTRNNCEPMRHFAFQSLYKGAIVSESNQDFENRHLLTSQT